jgi:hypothetical protein
MPYQENLLHNLRHHNDFIILPSDKNLGPCILEREEYIRRVLDNLADDTTYRQLSFPRWGRDYEIIHCALPLAFEIQSHPVKMSPVGVISRR